MEILDRTYGLRGMKAGMVASTWPRDTVGQTWRARTGFGSTPRKTRDVS